LSQARITASIAIQQKAVADSRFVADHFASEACGAELAAEVGEMNTEIMGLLRGLGTPDGVEEVGVGEHAAGVAGELGE
jgi:hypothetical protein